MNISGRSQTSFVASASVTSHLLRGGVGFLLLYWAFHHQMETVLSIIAALGALIALRGCPVCWTVGLIETMLDKKGKLRIRLKK